MTSEPPFVGSKEAAAILQTNAPQIVRWRKSGGVLPPAVAELSATWVWHRSDIVLLAEARERGLRCPETYPEHEGPAPRLVGTAEAANLAGVGKSQVGRWLRADAFPEPLLTLAAGPIWERATVRRWVAARARAAA